MLLLLFYYLFLTIFLFPYGVGTERMLNIRNDSFAITLLLGIIFQTAILTVTAFFFRLNLEVFCVNIFLSLIVGYIFRKEIESKLNSLLKGFHSWKSFYKILFLVIAVLVLAKSSLLPFIIDNESYYLQTIKWFNEYGFVKGLGNLHIYLAQGSPWHVLQAGWNFSFATDVINDINGFLFIICSFYYLSIYHEENGQSWIIYLLLFNVLLFQFIDSPSPDLPLLTILPILFYWFIKQRNTEIAILLFIYLLFVKITIAPLVLLLIFWKMDIKRCRFLILIALPFAVLWLVKNSILSGYPFYPFPFFALPVDWLVPENIRLFVIKITENTGYYVGNPRGSFGILHRLSSWFFLEGIAGILNKVILILFTVFPFTQSFRKGKRVRTLYFIMLLHFSTLLFTSPQFRFFLPEILFFGAVIIYEIMGLIDRNGRLGKLVIISGVLLPIIFLFPIKLKSVTSNINHQTTDSFKIEQILLPKPSSKFYNWNFEKKQKGNLHYYTPTEEEFYNTGNGELPCVSDVFLDYMEKNLKVVPQQKTADIGDGFYSKTVLK